MSDTEVVQEDPFHYVPIPPDSRSIHERLLAIQAELPAIGKDDFNQQQKFHFRSHDAVLRALNPLLAKHGVYSVPDVVDRQIGQRETRSGSVMYEVNLHVRYRFYGPAGDYVEASSWGEGTDTGDKSTNKAMTMAYKNVLAQTFAIATAELQDTDGSTDEATVARRGRTPRPDPPTGNHITDPANFYPPGFPPGSDLDKRIGQALSAVDPQVDWRATWDEALMLLGTARADLDKDGQRMAWTRLANVAEILSRYVDAFPPVTDEDIQQAFAACFEGVTPTVVRHELPEVTPDGE